MEGGGQRGRVGSDDYLTLLPLGETTEWRGDCLQRNRRQEQREVGTFPASIKM